MIVDNVSIRDNSIYSYNSQSKLEFKDFLYKFDEILEYDYENKLDPIKENIINILDTELKKIYTSEKYHIITDPEIIKKDKILLINNLNCEIDELRNMDYDEFEEILDKYDTSYYGEGNISDEYTEYKINQLLSLLEAEEYLLEAFEEKNRNLKKKSKVEKEEFENIKNKLSKEYGKVTIKKI